MKAGAQCSGFLFGVPSMFDSMEVKALCPT